MELRHQNGLLVLACFYCKQIFCSTRVVLVSPSQRTVWAIFSSRNLPREIKPDQCHEIQRSSVKSNVSCRVLPLYHHDVLPIQDDMFYRFTVSRCFPPRPQTPACKPFLHLFVQNRNVCVRGRIWDKLSCDSQMVLVRNLPTSSHVSMNIARVSTYLTQAVMLIIWWSWFIWVTRGCLQTTFKVRIHNRPSYDLHHKQNDIIIFSIYLHLHVYIVIAAATTNHNHDSDDDNNIMLRTSLDYGLVIKKLNKEAINEWLNVATHSPIT